MVSRRNYLAITIVMFVIVFMFQSTGVITEWWNDYEVNSYAKDVKELPQKSGAYSVNGMDAEDGLPSFKSFVVYIGEERMGGFVRTWASYTKRNMESYASIGECESAEWKKNKVPDMLIVDSACVKWEKELTYLEEYLEMGCDVIFCNMPDVSMIKKSKKMQNLFGIQNVKSEKTTVDGVHLYDGFLLGGEAVYLTSDEKERKKRQDMDLTLPWYELEAGTEVYMKGIMEDEGIESEEYPVIIWKKNYRDACVMAVNGKYMEEFGGIGILSAMVAQMEPYDIYPIVNAQNMVVVNYPVLSQENEEKLMGIYSRNMQGVMRDILWPGIMTAYRRNKLGLSCMMAPQLNYEDDILPDAKQLRFYMKNLNKEDAEVGLSGIYLSDTQLKEKLRGDYDFLQKNLPDYQFASFYADDLQEEELEPVLNEKIMSSVRTVVTQDRKDDEVIGYLSENVTNQKITAKGFTHTYRDDFRVRCIETMLGYTNILIDITDAVYPKNENDSWEKLAEDLNWNIQNYWKEFQSFQGTTISESDEYVRRFLALDYVQQREGNKISLHLSNMQEPVWFILRTHNETIEHMKGGSYMELEEDTFLLELKEAEAVITMESTSLSY